MIAGLKFQLRGSAVLVVAIALVWLASSASLFALTLSWAANSAGADGIQIERSSPDTNNFSQIAIVGAGATSFTDSGITCDTVFYYRVRAYNSGGESPYSNVAGPTSQACCTYSLSSSNVFYGSDGTNDSVGVTDDNSCAWTATSNTYWIRVTAGASGSSNSTVSYSVAPNFSSSTLTGTITIADQTLIVIQDGRAPDLVAITNAVDAVGGVPVLLSGETIGFNAGAVNNGGTPLTYAWDFGDGATSTESAPEHAFTDCGPYTVTVGISDGITTTNTALNVAVPCVLSVTNFRASVKFTHANQDNCSFKAVPQPSQCTNWLGTTVTLNVGGAQVSLVLDAKGRGVSANASCRFSYNDHTGVCELTAKLSRGTWRSVWAAYGFVNSDTPKHGVSVTLPVTLMINNEAFEADKPLLYTASANKSGSAK